MKSSEEFWFHSTHIYACSNSSGYSTSVNTTWVFESKEYTKRLNMFAPLNFISERLNEWISFGAWKLVKICKMNSYCITAVLWGKKIMQIKSERWIKKEAYLMKFTYWVKLNFLLCDLLCFIKFQFSLIFPRCKAASVYPFFFQQNFFIL